MNGPVAEEKWDLVIAGGGITGAGLLREAARNRLSALLVEERDFAWGTSSRSSKMIHGGLRYLREGRLLLTRDSVIHRQRLLREAPGLVWPFDLILPIYGGTRPSKSLIGLGLALYDAMSWKRQHRFLAAKRILPDWPALESARLIGAFQYRDAQVDDAALVQRLIDESVAHGAAALPYTRVERILRDRSGALTGAAIRDVETGEERRLETRCVINATGVWAERLQRSPDPRVQIRPLRGSHLVFPAAALPVPTGFSGFHPRDNRSFLVLPWQGVTLVGTTDLDHRAPLEEEPAITAEEVDYLLEALRHYFPGAPVSAGDCIASFAGVRPVLSRGRGLPPSKESREHAVWVENGLVTVTGGKLTTFRKLAWDALEAAIAFLPIRRIEGRAEPIFDPADADLPSRPGLTDAASARLAGRWGARAGALLQRAEPALLEPVPGTPTLWAELRFACEEEPVRHLDDLLLRRTRIGILCPDGGAAHLDRVEALSGPALSWSAERWKAERARYLDIWRRCYAPPRGSA